MQNMISKNNINNTKNINDINIYKHQPAKKPQVPETMILDDPKGKEHTL